MNEAGQQGGILYRFVQSLTGILLLACLICGYLGLRAIVWRHESELPIQLASGLAISSVIGTAMGLIYLVFGVHSLRALVRFDWMSVELGLVSGMLLYGIYNAISPLLPTYAREDVIARALQGAVDGALIGAFAGALVAIIGIRPTLLTTGGITRFIVLFLLTLGLLSVAVAISTQPGIPRNLGIWTLVPLVVVARLGVGLFDRIQAGRLKNS
jgi:hypothetical protein